MNYDLPPESKPDFAVEIPARYAVALLDACHLATRMLEITATSGKGQSSWLGVLVGREHLFGRIDIAQPSIPNPVDISEFGGHMKLTEQRALASQFRKAFTGPVRAALSLARDAFGNPAVYAVFHEPGLVFIPLSNRTPGRRRIAAVLCRDAATMEEERACVRLNQMSATTFRFLADALREIERHEIDEDPTLQADALDLGVRRTSYAEPAPPPAPPTPPPRSFDDEEDLIDDEVVDLDDPTESGADSPPPHGDDDGGGDDMDMTVTPF